MPLFSVYLLEKLKTIFKGNIHIHDLFHLTINNVHITKTSPPEAKPIVYIAPDTLNLNVDKFPSLPSDQREELISVIREAVRVEGNPIFEDNSKERLKDIAIVENRDDVKAILDFFKDKIPQEDHAALRSAIYIKNKFDANATQDEIFSLKNDLRAKFGMRGMKISKLWSEHYFEDLIQPLYTQLSRGADFSKEDFLRYYNLVIEEEAFAVFVPHSMTPLQLMSIVRRKITSNMRYGVYFITIHGIGKETVDTIKEIVPSIEDEYEIADKSFSEKYYIIKVKFWFTKS